MDSTASRFSSSSKNEYKIFLIASALGTILEFLEFSLFGAFATVISRVFVNSNTSSTSILMTWAIFFVGFLARPMGAVYFGYVADKYTIKKSLLLSMTLMFASTFGIGVLPGFEYLGTLSVVILVILRLVQGFAVAPEYSMPAVYFNNLGHKSSLFLSSFTVSAAAFGLWLGTFFASVFECDSFSWRYVYIGSSLLIFSLGVAFRVAVKEPGIDFMGLKKYNSKPSLMIVSFQVFKSFLLSGTLGVFSYTLFAYVSTYLQIARSWSIMDASKVISTSSILIVIFAPASTYLCSKAKSIELYILIILTLMVLSGLYLLFQLQQGATYYLWVAMLLFSSLVGSFSGVLPGYIASLFPRVIRGRGATMSFSFGMSMLGGTAPFLFTLIEGKKSVVYIGWYYAFLYFLCALSLFPFVLKKTSYKQVCGPDMGHKHSP